MIEPQMKVNYIREGGCIYAMEILNKRGKDRVQEFYRRNWADIRLFKGYNSMLMMQYEEEYSNQEIQVDLV